VEIQTDDKSDMKSNKINHSGLYQNENNKGNLNDNNKGINKQKMWDQLDYFNVNLEKKSCS